MASYVKKLKGGVRQHQLLVPILSVAVLFLAINLQAQVGTHDDMWFKQLFARYDNNPLRFTRMHYETWSSRSVIELALVYLVNAPWLWRLLNTVMMTICAVVPAFLVNWRQPKNTAPSQILAGAGLTVLIPGSLYNETGWMATTLNYEWVVAFDLLVVLSIVALLNQWRHPKLWGAFGVFTTIYGANQEQSNVLLLCGLMLTILYLIKQKNFTPVKVLSCYELIVLLELAYIKFSPGNVARYHDEVKHWFPNFESLSLLKKFEIGYSTTLKGVFFDWQLVTLLLVLAIALGVVSVQVTHHRHSLMWLIGLFPLVANLILTSYYPLSGPSGKLVNSIDARMGSGISWHHLHTFIPDLLLTVLAVMALIAIVYVVPDKLEKVVLGLAFCAGICARIIMGFSPTVAASGMRTFWFTYQIMNVVVLFMLNNRLIPKNVSAFGNYGIASLGLMGWFLWLA